MVVLSSPAANTPYITPPRSCAAELAAHFLQGLLWNRDLWPGLVHTRPV